MAKCVLCFEFLNCDKIVMAQFTPIVQRRFSYVSVVKDLIKADKERHRFEIACYPNKVMAQRQKLQSRLSEVLQSDLNYTNLSKAEIASKEHLKDAFQTADINEICKFEDELRNMEDRINSHEIKCPHFDIGCSDLAINNLNINDDLVDEEFTHTSLSMDSKIKMAASQGTKKKWPLN